MTSLLAGFYALAMAVLLVYGLNLLWMAVVHARLDALREGPVPAYDVPPAWKGPWPDVTVQLPLYNEAHVADRLVDACARLDYPRAHLEIQVLDDSTDATTERVARRIAYWHARGLDVVHVRRTHREGYKAGALQNGLRMARGSLIALFDADFVPRPDFLRQVVPHFDAPGVGMVQARWGHLNADASLLTRIQAVGLDAHFAIEQDIRHRAGCFINFNGTAGVWRRACIEEAGGWQGDTLAEDLDLSYRAQLVGWRFRFLPDLQVDAELPVEMSALRAQQFRWTKGAVETARKVLWPLWRSDRPLGVKVEGTFHLTAHFVFPFILVAALLHAPLLWRAHAGLGPGEAYFAVMGLGLLGFAGFVLSQLFAQRTLYPDWTRRLRYVPLFMAGSMGLAVNNTRAIWQGLLGKRSAFVRTPKYSGVAEREGWRKSRYAEVKIPGVVWVEAVLALYCLAGLVLLVGIGAWAAIPFQALFAVGFGLVAGLNLRQVFYLRWTHPAPEGLEA